MPPPSSATSAFSVVRFCKNSLETVRRPPEQQESAQPIRLRGVGSHMFLKRRTVPRRRRLRAVIAVAMAVATGGITAVESATPASAPTTHTYPVTPTLDGRTAQSPSNHAYPNKY